MDLTQITTEAVTVVDPNALLAQLRDAARSTMDAWDDPELSDTVTVNEMQMAEAFLSLDDWVARGGFLPTAWRPDED